MKKKLLIIILLGYIAQSKAQFFGGIQDGYAKAFPIKIPDPCLIILPIELINFSGEYLTDNRQVKLDWLTSSEINNDYFIVQKSIDAISWSDIEIINGAGNSNYRINYSTYDKTPEKGLNYYRLKQVDNDGKINYSNIISIQTKNEIESFTIYPNPAFDYIQVLGLQGFFKYKIYNSNGILVKEGYSFSTEQISITKFEQGLYHLIIEDTSNVVSKKINIIH
jgi:hypothetical protein